MGKHDIRNILLGGGILAALYFLFKGGLPSWPPANGGNGGITYYTCPYCGAKFTTQAELALHIATQHVTPSLPPEVLTQFVCPECGEVFQWDASIYLGATMPYFGHLKTHAGYDLYAVHIGEYKGFVIKKITYTRDGVAEFWWLFDRKTGISYYILPSSSAIETIDQLTGS